MTTNMKVKITRQNLRDLTLPSEAFITDVENLSSYNWVDSPEPTIAVPGSPPVWSPPRGPCQVQRDSGHIFIAQNAARHPESPLEPLFRALYIAHPSLDMRSVDLISDRNNIRKLFSVINPESAKNGLETFTINVESAGNTVILARDEVRTEDFIGPGDFKGYGHEFEKLYTANRLDGSTGHHRIISYRFSNMKFIIRHETDGFMDTNLKKPQTDPQDWEEDILSGELASLSLSSDKSSHKVARGVSKLRIKKEGSVVPLESTLEIKTRTARKPMDFKEVATQIWVSQTPKLVRAYHNRGLFQEPVVEDVTQDIKNWEQVNQSDLRKLAALVTEILRIAREIGGRMMIKYDQMTDSLVLQKSEGKKMLPNDLYSHWDKKAELDVQSPRPVHKVSGEGEEGEEGTKLVSV